MQTNGPYVLSGDDAERLAKQVRYPKANPRARDSFLAGVALVEEFAKRGYAVVVPRDPVTP